MTRTTIISGDNGIRHFTLKFDIRVLHFAHVQKHRMHLDASYAGDKKKTYKVPTILVMSFACVDRIAHVFVDCLSYLDEHHDLEMAFLHLDNAPLQSAKTGEVSRWGSCQVGQGHKGAC